VKELLIYGADVNIKDSEGFSFLDLTTSEAAFAGLGQLIAAAAKDPRAKKAQEAGRAMRDLRQIAEQRAAERRTAESDGGLKEEWTDPFENLPPELCIHIFSFLSIAELSRACLVSTLWCCVGTGTLATSALFAVSTVELTLSSLHSPARTHARRSRSVEEAVHSTGWSCPCQR
jgi:hypothetical protein